MRKIVLLAMGGLLFACQPPKQESRKFLYSSEKLSIDEYSVKDSLRTLTIDSLSSVIPQNKTKIKSSTPFTEKLWQVALSDVESNIVETQNGRYFGAGKQFGVRIYTRDISFSGILGVNQLYPDEVLSSLKVTRNVRLDLAFKVPTGYVIPEIDVEWEELDMKSIDYLHKYHTNCYVRRTDDVVWMWAANDLFDRHPDKAEWDWLYEKGKECFAKLYDPFFDPTDGLYRGQASFIDIHYLHEKTTGYPQEYSIADCVMLKSLSTNCLFYKGLVAMSNACENTGKADEANFWEEKAQALKTAIVKELSFENGTLAYFKSREGQLEPRRGALGTALAVISGIVEGEAAQKAMADYEITWRGVALLNPFYPWKGYYHNNTSWPYVDSFFLWAKEMVDGKDYTDLNAALLARTCVGTGSFHEVTNWTTCEPYGSGSQLWSAAGFINTCMRAGIVELEK